MEIFSAKGGLAWENCAVCRVRKRYGHTDFTTKGGGGKRSNLRKDEHDFFEIVQVQDKKVAVPSHIKAQPNGRMVRLSSILLNLKKFCGSK